MIVIKKEEKYITCTGMWANGNEISAFASMRGMHTAIEEGLIEQAGLFVEDRYGDCYEILKTGEGVELIR